MTAEEYNTGNAASPDNQNAYWQQDGYQPPTYQQQSYQQPYVQQGAQGYQPGYQQQPYTQQDTQSYQQPYAQQNAQGYQQPYAQQEPQGYQQPYAQTGYQQPYGQPGYQQPYGAPGAQGYQPGYQQPYGQAVHAKDHIVAGLLGIFLGWLGIHKFYLGYNQTGIIMLAVSILGSLFTFGLAASVMGVIGIIEGIIYLTKTPDEFDRTYVFGAKEWF